MPAGEISGTSDRADVMSTRSPVIPAPESHVKKVRVLSPLWNRPFEPSIENGFRFPKLAPPATSRARSGTMGSARLRYIHPKSSAPQAPSILTERGSWPVRSKVVR